MPSSRPESPEAFEYPPVRVNDSLAQLDLNTLMMRSNVSRSAQEAQSLDESSYDLLSDSVFSTSDDEGHTASVASTDVSFQTFSGSESEDDDFGPHYNDESAPLGEATAADPLDAQVMAAGEDSTLTEKPHPGDSDSGIHMSMHERTVTFSDDTEGIEGCSIIKEFSPEQTSEGVLKPYGCSEVRLALRAALSDRFYPDHGVFRVLFIGRMDAWDEEKIKSTILNALLASPGSSRSIMVRGQMEPYSPILHTDHCTDFRVFKDQGPKDVRLVVTLDDKDAAQLIFMTKGRRMNVGSATFPDLVICCHPQTNPTAIEPRNLSVACTVFKQFGIPCLDITDHRRFRDSSGLSIGRQNLRVCVEGRTTKGTDFVEQEAIPVDVFTFMQLDPAQLNRHLAAITPHSRLLEQLDDPRSHKAWSFRKLVPSFLERYLKATQNSASATLKLVLSLVVLTGFVTFYLLGATRTLQYQVGNGMSTYEGEKTPPSPYCETTVDVPTTSQTISSMTSTKVPNATSFTPTPQLALAPSHNRGSKKTRGESEKKDGTKLRMSRKPKALGFQIQTTGEQQFILLPSKDLIGRSRKPQLQIQVSRGATILPIQYVRTSEGAYIVSLEQDYPIGPCNVSIATYSKPLMQQSFNVSLGNNKPSVAQWMDTLKRELTAGRRELQSSMNLYAGMVRNGVGAVRHLEAQQLQDNVKEEAKRQMDAGMKLVQGLQRQTWMTMRKATAPARTSRLVLRARNNSYVIRCGLERAVGLSKDEKKTRSCEAVDW